MIEIQIKAIFKILTLTNQINCHFEMAFQSLFSTVASSSAFKAATFSGASFSASSRNWAKASSPATAQCGSAGMGFWGCFDDSATDSFKSFTIGSGWSNSSYSFCLSSLSRFLSTFTCCFSWSKSSLSSLTRLELADLRRSNSYSSLSRDFWMSSSFLSPAFSTESLFLSYSTYLRFALS